MTFNFNFATTATVNAKTVEEMVRHCIEAQTGRKVSRIEFTSSQEYDRMDRPSGISFNGCVVHFAEVPVAPAAPQFRTQQSTGTNPWDR